jgi:hypothetical protein
VESDVEVQLQNLRQGSGIFDDLLWRCDRKSAA